jgi:hypothetical protein
MEGCMRDCITRYFPSQAGMMIRFGVEVVPAWCGLAFSRYPDAWHFCGGTSAPSILYVGVPGHRSTSVPAWCDLTFSAETIVFTAGLTTI